MHRLLLSEMKLGMKIKTFQEITLGTWIKKICVALEKRGMDTVFYVYESSTQTKIYLLESYGIVTKNSGLNLVQRTDNCDS